MSNPRVTSSGRTVPLELSELQRIFHEAICCNKVDFVRLFLEQGVHVRDYLTVSELESLYNHVNANSVLFYLLKQTSSCRHESSSTEKNPFTVSDVGRLIKHLTSSEYETENRYYIRASIKQRAATSVRRPSFPQTNAEDDEDIGRYRSTKKQRGSSAIFRFEEPFQELFLYASLRNRFELAKLFWERCREPIAAALTATKMLETISFVHYTNFPDECESMKSTTKKLEQMAVDILDECQDESAARTTELLTVTRPNWDNTSCVLIAFSAQNLVFTSHISVQTVLNRMWLGDISSLVSSKLIWLATLFPPLMWCIQFESANQEEQELQDRTILHEETTDVETIRKASYQPLSTADIIGEFGNSPEGGLTCFQRMVAFFSSPAVKFRLHLIVYLVFLAQFSYVMLSNFHEDISRPEALLIFWVFTLFLDEIRQIVDMDKETWEGKIRVWINDSWNRMDIFNFLLFFLGLILRMSHANLDAARIVLCINLMTFFIRVLYLFLVVRKLGPKLLMIGKMIIDLVMFISILVIFLLSYGIASQAILYPNQEDPVNVFKGILYRAYFQVFGELYLDVIMGPEGCTRNETMIEEGNFSPCPDNSWTGLILLAVYMLISNVLLLNLLIAMFSYTFSTVQDNTDAFWKFHRYRLIKEYIDKPFLVPPFIIAAHIYRLIRYLSSRRCGEDNEKLLDEEPTVELQSLIGWESLQLESYVAKQRQKDGTNVGEQVQRLNKRIEEMERAASVERERTASLTRQMNDQLQAMGEQLSILLQRTEHLNTPC
ncbi:transient receptor potential cation channel subfamily M member 5-like [Diadema setosum]|uniref:transient receptor potential cation channel subfamily M member 5-like n=1 Tax=Diadema setosum TaxID=31175 RepID=UPI003B3AF6C5